MSNVACVGGASTKNFGNVKTALHAGLDCTISSLHKSHYETNGSSSLVMTRIKNQWIIIIIIIITLLCGEPDFPRYFPRYFPNHLHRYMHKIIQTLGRLLAYTLWSHDLIQWGRLRHCMYVQANIIIVQVLTARMKVYNHSFYPHATCLCNSLPSSVTSSQSSKKNLLCLCLIKFFVWEGLCCQLFAGCSSSKLKSLLLKQIMMHACACPVFDKVGS